VSLEEGVKSVWNFYEGVFTQISITECTQQQWSVSSYVGTIYVLLLHSQALFLDICHFEFLCLGGRGEGARSDTLNSDRFSGSVLTYFIFGVPCQK
jgi:hypothetical protein